MYSQFGEEAIILQYFGDKTDGRFIDVGAWDGKTFSNTYALTERGWSGVLIEPSLEGMLGLLKTHGYNPNMTLVHAAMAIDHGLIYFYNTPDAVSTSQPDHYETWRKATKYTGQFYCPTVTWGDILNQFGGADFVNIDTEGTSVDLLFVLLAHAQPPLICVEHDNRIVEATERARKYNYRVLDVNSTNLILGQ